jgi:hypothetical protein
MGKLTWGAFLLALLTGACTATSTYFQTADEDAGLAQSAGTDDGNDSGSSVDDEKRAQDTSDASTNDGAAASDADAAPDVDATAEAGPDSGPDSGTTTDPGQVDAGACNGVVRYDIPTGHYAYGKKCNGFQLSLSAHNPPTQEECQHGGQTFKDKCLKWNAFESPLSIYFIQADGGDCDIQIFPKLESGDTYKCTQNN